MTREEMLSEIGLSDGDFRDFLTKVAAFRSSLNPQQLAFYNRSMPTVAEVAQAFGPDVSIQDVENLFAEAPPINGIACIFWGQGPGHRRWPGGHDPK